MKSLSASVKRTIATNAMWNWAGYAVTVAIAFVMCPLLVRGLGDERYGIWSVVEATVAYLALLDLGIGASIVRYVAKFEEIEDRQQLNRVFSTTLCLFVAAAGLAMMVAITVALVWKQPFHATPDMATEARWLILLLGANVAVELIGGVFGAVLYGLARFPAKVSVDSGIRVATAGAFLAVLASGGGLIYLGIAILGATTAKAVVQAIVVRHYLPHLRFSPSAVNAETFRMIRGYSVQAFVAMIAGRISYSSDAIVIGAFLAPQWITFFVVAARLTEYVKSSIRSLTTVLTPAISAREARGDMDAIRRVFLDASRYTLWLVLPIQMGLIILGKPFLSLWLGDRYAVLSYPTLVILSIPLVFVLSQSVSGRILYGIGRLRYFTCITVAQAVVNLSLSILLIGPLGITGVALGTAIPAVLHSICLAIYMCSILHVPLSQYLRESLVKPMCGSVVPVVAWLAVSSHATTSWLSLFVVGATGLTCLVAMGLLLEIGPRRLHHAAAWVIDAVTGNKRSTMNDMLQD